MTGGSRHRGTNRTAEQAAPTIARPESPAATGEQLVARLSTIRLERMIIEAIQALVARTGRVNGSRSVVSKHADLGAQYLAAKLHLHGGKPAREVLAEVGGTIKCVPERTLSRWLALVRREYNAIYVRHLAELEQAEHVASARGDLPALASMMWSELAVKVIGYLRSVDYGEIDNNTRHLLQRCAEGSADAAKTFTEAARTEAQTAGLLRKLRAAIEAEGGESRTVDKATIARIIDEALGLAREAAA